MALSYSAVVANAKLDQIETTIGAAPELRIYNGTAPTNADTALSGNTLLASGTLPSDWLAAASSKTKAKAGSWTLTGQAGAGAGTAGTFWRIYVTTTCHMQGTFTATGGGGDMTVDNNSIANGQTLTVNTFSITEGN